MGVRQLAAVIVSLGSTLAFAAEPATRPSYSEAMRPQFHFSAARNWLNDPNGLVFADGVYHLFFQYDPASRSGEHKAWGHATSPDLIHWTERAVALSPDELGDIWSGSAVIDADNISGFGKDGSKPIILIYTAAGGINAESKGKSFTQCLAYSNDGGQTWTKYAENPVLPHIRGGNRDPKVIWHAPSKQWILTLYLDGDDFTFFASPDLKRWSHLQDMHVPGCAECPDFYEMPIDGEPGKSAWVWTNANAMYLVGEFDGRTFIPEHGFNPVQSEFGRNFYAGQTFSNLPDQRRVQIAWMWRMQYPGMPFNQQMTFPTELTLKRTPDGLRLFRWPVKEIEQLRETAVRRSNVALVGQPESICELKSDELDLSFRIDLGTAKAVGLHVAGQAINFDVTDRELSVLGSAAPLQLINGQIELRVLVDRTSVEIFANGGAASLTCGMAPDPRSATLPPEIFAEGGDAKLVSFEGYALHSAWLSKDGR